MKWPFVLLLLACSIAGCGDEAPYDVNDSVPAGDPAFPRLEGTWVVDTAKVLDAATVQKLHGVLQNLRDDHIAEVVVLIADGIRHPEDYATHFGRWLRLGQHGATAEGGQNGLVWLVRPADQKISVSIGRGLPRLTMTDCVDIGTPAKTCMARRDFSTAIRQLVTGTDSRLRQLYGKRKE